MENMRIERAGQEDLEAVYALYRSLLSAPYSTWDEDYPTREIIEGDVLGGHTMVMRDENGEIAAAIAILPDEDDPQFDRAASWYPDVKRWAFPSRLGVAMAHQGKGLAGRMLSAAMDAARENGCDAVRFLVSKHNPIAQRAYAKLAFDVCGETEMWGEAWLCYQKRL